MDPRRLREETRPEHEATEAQMPLTGPALNRDLYLQTLAILLPLVASWEQWAAANAPKDLSTMLPVRRRSHLLAADLKALGAETDGLASEPMDWSFILSAAGIAGRAEVRRAAYLGALYVMEGSTLGGRFIARYVEEALHLEPGVGDSYFRGHGEATGSLWREVTNQIAAVPDDLAKFVVDSAKKTFVAFGAALRSGFQSRTPVRS